ncbi:glycine-rich protein, partial [Hymenobacter lucidus]
MQHTFTFAARAVRPLRRPLLAGFGLLLALAGAAQAQTSSFAYTGGLQTYTVPAGIRAVEVVATGASGGTYNNNFNAAHLNGAVVRATLTVVPGEVLTVAVGGQGGNGSLTLFNGAGGYNGGGVGKYSGGGGGATDVRRASSAGSTGDYLTTRNALLVAGGSGGAGLDNTTLYSALGGGGGVPNGGDGQGRGTPGLGATQTAPGGGGVPGSGATGGSGNSSGLRCGGGGGGYYGGGGASTTSGGSGGGGGSSWVMPTGSRDISYRLAPAVNNGSVTITPVVAYAYTGGPQTYIVPAGVKAVRVTATGASGGTGGGSVAPAKGAVVQATVFVTPGEVLTLYVGGAGSSGGSGTVAGGYNGGGNGRDSGAGGGATDVRRASSAGSTGDYLTTRNALVVAGGGGGSDYTAASAGGSGGVPVGADGVGGGTPGRGATQAGP